MKYSKLRIGLSVGFAVFSALAIVLWIRSFYVLDSMVFKYSPAQTFSIGSYRGWVGVTKHRIGLEHLPTWSFDTLDTTKLDPKFDKTMGGQTSFQVWPLLRLFKDYTSIRVGPYLGVVSDSGGGGIAIAHGLLASLLAVGSVLSLRAWNFSLRTLLIVITIISVGFGVAAYVLRTYFSSAH